MSPVEFVPPPAKEYRRALQELSEQGKGIHPTHLELLRTHFEAAHEPISWRTLGERANREWTTVNLQYGTFAGRLAAKLGIHRKPKGFWLYVIAEWSGKDSLGEQRFLMRPELIDALSGLTWFSRKGRVASPPAPESGPEGGAVDTSDPPDRTNVTVRRIVRDTSIVRDLKQLHRNTCQRCGKRLKMGRSTFYSEGHHLRPLGEPHNGPDARSNILILCPNCHALLDYAAVTIEPRRLRKHGEHALAAEYIDYHNGLARSR